MDGACPCRCRLCVEQDFINELNDGHCSIVWNAASCPDPEAAPADPYDALHAQDAGGDFGVTFADSPDGVRVVAPSDGSPVALGTKLLKVYTDASDAGTCVAIDDYLPRVKGVRWVDTVPATAAHKRSEQLRFLSRGAVGAKLVLQLDGQDNLSR